MSLLTGLETHDKHPGDLWGRYSTSNSSHHDNSLNHNDSSPENDEVCLISTSMSPRSTRGEARRRGLRNNRQRNSNEKPIEIKEDPVSEAPRSSTDKNPKEFIAEELADFTIPKTKKETSRARGGSSSPGGSTVNGRWLTTSNHQHSRRHAKLQFENVAEGRPGGRAKNGKLEPVRLNRAWNHTTSPRRSTRNSPPTDGLSRLQRDYAEKTSDANKCSSLGISEVTPNRFKNSNKCGRFYLKVNLLEKTNSSSRPSTILDTCEEHGENQNCERTSVAESSSDTNHSRIVQEDLFCSLCKGQITKHGCLTCSKTTDDFDELSSESSHPTESFYGKKSSELSEIIRFKMAENGPLNTKRKHQTRKRTGPVRKQTKIDTSGLKSSKTNQVRGRKTKTSQERKKPELVHISSDEEEKEESETGHFEISKEEDVSQEIKDDSTQEGQSSEDFKETSVKSSRSRQAERKDASLRSDAETGRKKKKEKHGGKGKEATNYERGSLNLNLIVKEICLGRLRGTSSVPVEIENDKITMIINVDDSNYTIKLTGRDLCSVKICSKVEPLMIIIPTPGWARKVNERIPNKGAFIDPGSTVYEERQILLLLHDELNQEDVSDLTELVVEGSSGPSTVEEISPKDAKTELERILSVSDRKSLSSKKSNLSSNEESSCIKTPSLSASSPGSSVETHASPSLLSRTRTRKRSSSSTSDDVHTLVKRPSSPSADWSLSVTRAANNESDTQPTVSSPEATLSFTAPVKARSYNTRSKHPTSPCSQRRPPEKVLVYPSFARHGAITITTEDVDCLSPDVYLNDVIIDFFLKYLTEEQLTDRDKERTHIFSTFFYNRLTQPRPSGEARRTPEYMHGLVRTWTKNVDIFSKDFLIVPINQSNHWFLAVICYPCLVAKPPDENFHLELDNSGGSPSLLEMTESQGCGNSERQTDSTSESKKTESDDDDFDRPVIKTRGGRKNKTLKVPLEKRPCILLFDSLTGMIQRNTVLINLRNYLTCEWKERKRDEEPVKFDPQTMAACHPKAPCQLNCSDCGVYVLQYVESFFKTPITDYSFPIRLPDWFSEQEISQKREFIRNLIFKLRDNSSSRC